MRLAFVVLVSLSLIPGCSREEPIRVYTAPKASEPSFRILGGIFPKDNPSWFFKLAGRSDQLGAIEADFDKFLAGVRFPNGKQNSPVWDLPAGWREGRNESQFSTATILIGSETAPLKLTISNATGGLEPNLARWAGQVGLAWQPGDQSKYAKPLAADSGWKVDLTGPQNPSARGMMPGRQ